MNRRGFLELLASAATVPLVPMPELLMPTRTIFLPPRGGWVGGCNLLSMELIMREAIRVLHQDIEFAAQINRVYDPAFSHRLEIAPFAFSNDDKPLTVSSQFRFVRAA